MGGKYPIGTIGLGDIVIRCRSREGMRMYVPKSSRNSGVSMFPDHCKRIYFISMARNIGGDVDPREQSDQVRNRRCQVCDRRCISIGERQRVADLRPPRKTRCGVGETCADLQGKNGPCCYSHHVSLNSYRSSKGHTLGITTLDKFR
jgi:hypothetical protein